MPLQIEEAGRGEPVLLIPGFTEGVGDIRVVFDELAKRFHVIAADLPGSGGSAPIPREYSRDMYEGDTRRMAAVLDERGITSARVVGFSDGGEVGLLLAVRRPDLVSALVIWGAIGVVPATLRPLLDTFADLVDHPPERMKAWRDKLVIRYGGADTLRRTMRSWTAAVRAILDGGGDISLSMADQIQCRVLVIAGEKDPFCPGADVRTLGATLRQADVHIVADAGHSVHDDKREWFMTTVREWLASTDPHTA